MCTSCAFVAVSVIAILVDGGKIFVCSSPSLDGNATVSHPKCSQYHSYPSRRIAIVFYSCPFLLFSVYCKCVWSWLMVVSVEADCWRYIGDSALREWLNIGFLYSRVGLFNVQKKWKVFMMVLILWFVIRELLFHIWYLHTVGTIVL